MCETDVNAFWYIQSDISILHGTLIFAGNCVKVILKHPLEYSLNDLKISENFEFGRIGKPHFKGEGINDTPKTRGVSLNILAHARTIDSPPNPGDLRYSLNFKVPIKFEKINQILTSIYK